MALKQPNPRPQFLLKIALAFLVFFGFSTAAQTVRASFFDDILSLPNQLAEGAQIAITEVFNQASLASVFNDIQCFFGFNCTETTINQEPTTNNENQISRNQNPTTEDQKPQQPESQTTTQTNQQEAPTTQITQIINPTKEIQTIHTITNNTNTVVVDTDTKNQVNQLLRQLNSDRPNYSTGQTVSLPTNLVSKTLNITSGDFNVDENGNVTANDITSNGNLTVQGNFAVAGSQTYSGAASFTATSTTPALLIEQTGSGNALQADNVTIKDSIIATNNGGALQFQTANNYLDATGNLVLAGDIVANKYNGLTINPTTKSLTVSNDATVSGTNTGDQTITLTGDITGSGTGSFATTIGNAKVTNAMLAGSIAASKLIGTDIATVGTITTGIWNGTTISPAKGGTGVANGTNNTITFTGNYTLGLTLSANTSLTLPTSGTLATTSDKLNAFASTSSSELAGTVSDETGSGSLVFATSPTFTTQLTTPKVVGDTTGLYLNEDGGAGIFVKDGGNVGIGNTNPSSKLDVTGDIRISSGSGGQIIFADGSTMASAGLGSAAALSNTTDAIVTGDSDANNTGAVILKTGSNDRLHILNGGNIGIGTATPNTKLDVRGGINAGTNGTEFTLSSAGAVVAITYNGLSLTSQATGYTISGGTSSKTLTLDDNLTATTINSHLASTSNPHSVTQSQVGLGSVENTALSTWAGTGNIATVGTITTGIWNGSTIPVAYGGTGTATGSITGTGALTFAAGGSNQNVTLTPSGTGYTVLNGNVGVGTATPRAKFSLGGGSLGKRILVYDSGNYYAGFGSDIAGADSFDMFAHGSSGDGYITFGQMGTDGTTYTEWARMKSGNMGIGTTNPGYKLESYANSNSFPSLIAATNASSGNAAGASIVINNNYSNLDLGLLGTGNTTTPTYGSAGDAYIRTGASAGSLNFIVPNGTATAMMKFFVGGGADGTPSMVLDNSNNVGIGTTSPLLKLDVAGDINLSGSGIELNNHYLRTATGNAEGVTVEGGDFVGLRSRTGVAYLDSYTDTVFRDVSRSYATKFQVRSVGDAVGALNVDTKGAAIIYDGSSSADERVGLGLYKNLSDWTAADRSIDIVFGQTGSYHPEHYFGKIRAGRSSTDGGKGYLGFHAGGYGTADQMVIVSNSNSDGNTTANVGIGTTTPAARLDVAGGVRLVTNNSGYVYIGSEDNGLEGAGVQLEGAGSYDSWYMDVYANDIRFLSDSSNSNTFSIFNNGSGTTSLNVEGNIAIGSQGYKPGGGSWAASSDERLKKNIVPISGALEKITQLQGVSFDWKNPQEHGNDARLQGGFIAQDVQRIFPNWVQQIDPNGADKDLIPRGEKSLSLSLPFEFDALIVEAIKEQQTQINDLKLQLTAEGLIAASTTEPVVQQNGGFVEMIKNAIVSLFQAGIDGIKNFSADKITSKQMCIKGDDGVEVCLTRDQMKDLIQKAGSSMTVNQEYQPPAAPMNNGTTTQTGAE